MTGPEHTETVHGPSVPTASVVLAGTLEAIGAGAYVVDEQGCIIAANTRAEQLLGRSADDLTGHDAHDLLHRGPQGQPLPRTQCAMRQAFHAGRTAQADQDYFACADGTLLRISWLITPYDVGGRHAGTLVVFHTPTTNRPPTRCRSPRPSRCRSCTGWPCSPRPPHSSPPRSTSTRRCAGW